jgi:hypothetical protein
MSIEEKHIQSKKMSSYELRNTGLFESNDLLTNPKYKRELYAIFGIGCLIGAIIFLIVYGYRILDVQYVNWIYSNPDSDLFQAQMGFDYFRNSDWGWPIGYYMNFGYPFGTSIVFTDSLPLFAIVSKSFGAVLPESFQYLGIWGLLCCCLQGGLSSIILRRYTSKRLLILLIIPIFVVLPVLTYRMFSHCSLSAHWLILAAIFIYVYRDSIPKLKSRVIFWSVLCALCVTIHAYFIVMIGVMLVGFLIDDFMHFKNIKRILLIGGAAVLSTIAVFWLVGGFFPTTRAIGGLGLFSMNLNALFNRIFLPNNIFNIMQPLPTAYPEQYEGLNYLGLGGIIMLVFWLFFKTKDTILFFKAKKRPSNCNIRKHIPVIFVCVILTVLALSPIITFYDKTLFSYMDFPLVQRILGSFRATGRFFWPVFYLILIYLFAFLVKRVSRQKWITILLVACTVIQLFDLSAYLNEKSKLTQNEYNYQTTFVSTFWEEVPSTFEHIEVLYNADHLILNELALYSLQHGMTMNTGYFSRANYSAINERIEKIKSDLFLQKNWDEDSLYIMGHGEHGLPLLTNTEMIELQIDGFYVVFAKGSMDLDDYKNNIIQYIPDEPKQADFILSAEKSYKVDMEHASFKLSDIQVSKEYKAGSSFELNFNFTNTSQQVYPSKLYFDNPAGISYHWYDENDHIVIFDYPRVYFTKNVMENDTIPIDMTIEVPSVEPGKYKLMIDIVQENIAWLSDISTSKYVYEIDIF